MPDTTVTVCLSAEEMYPVWTLHPAVVPDEDGVQPPQYGDATRMPVDLVADLAAAAERFLAVQKRVTAYLREVKDAEFAARKAALRAEAREKWQRERAEYNERTASVTEAENGESND